MPRWRRLARRRLAVVVVWMFLRDWRATLISAVAMPLSLIPTFSVLAWLDQSLNIVTLLALSLTVGILVDDAIVEIENIVRHMRRREALSRRPRGRRRDRPGGGGDHRDHPRRFVPVAFMPGIPGQFFKRFAIAACVAVIFSLVVARPLTPLMGAYLVRRARSAAHPHAALGPGIPGVACRAPGSPPGRPGRRPPRLRRVAGASPPCCRAFVPAGDRGRSRTRSSPRRARPSRRPTPRAGRTALPEERHAAISPSRPTAPPTRRRRGPANHHPATCAAPPSRDAGAAWRPPLSSRNSNPGGASRFPKPRLHPLRGGWHQRRQALHHPDRQRSGVA